MTRRTALGIVAAILTLATVVIVPLANRAIPSEPPLSTWTATTTTTPAPVTTPPATVLAPITATLPPPTPRLPRQEGRFRSTAYCLTGRMASGAHTYVGAVAGNRWGIGTVITAWPNPWGDPDMEFVVEDRHAQADGDGYPTQIDFAMPGECDRAAAWGNRTFVTVHVTGEQQL